VKDAYAGAFARALDGTGYPLLRKAWGCWVNPAAPTETRPDRTYEFFIHAECLKSVAKAGFAGLEKV
jgi:hypothetical protein